MFPLDWPSLAWLPLGGPTIRIEEFLEEDEFVVRAELPGVDPEKDVQVTVEDGILQIKVERTEEHKEKGHSEFHYGSFFRTVTLPPGAKVDGIKARYETGILEIRVGVGEPAAKGREIPVVIGNGKKS
jgi:HSP20 family protein